MTNEEAVNELIKAFDVLDRSWHMNNRRKEAFNKAYAALKAEPCEDCCKAEEIMQTLCDYGCEMKIQDAISQVLETECTKCEDAVSRIAALDALRTNWANWGDYDDGYLVEGIDGQEK